jgi:hypothetical protein
MSFSSLQMGPAVIVNGSTASTPVKPP